MFMPAPIPHRDLKRRPARRANPEAPAVFAFDLLALRGKDMRALPLLERKAVLYSVLQDSHHLRYLQHVREFYRHFKAARRELWSAPHPMPPREWRKHES